MDDQAQIITFILIAFPIFFAMIWCLVMLICSLVGGWNKLAGEYSAKERDLSKVDWHSWQRGQIGLIEMKSTFWIGVSPDGLYLSTGPAFLFRFMHPPLLIPWQRIAAIKDVNKIFFSGTNLKIDGVNVTIPRALGDEARKYIDKGIQA